MFKETFKFIANLCRAWETLATLKSGRKNMTYRMNVARPYIFYFWGLQQHWRKLHLWGSWGGSQGQKSCYMSIYFCSASYDRHERRTTLGFPNSCDILMNFHLHRKNLVELVSKRKELMGIVKISTSVWLVSGNSGSSNSSNIIIM